MKALLAWAETVYSGEDIAAVVAGTSICFDLSIFELLVPLTRGGTVYVLDHILHLPQFAASRYATLINTVPSAIPELLRQTALAPSVRIVNLAGEPLKPELADRIYGLGTVNKVYDLYGPSEDTTYSTCALREVNGPEIIGKPLANTRLYIVDGQMNPMPLGIPGEIYLGGSGLARGYLGRPELTAERWVPDPFSERGGERLYRTGDRGRWNASGQVEYLGRMDQQVKIRGFRIEPGEIEAALAVHAQVREAAVVPREGRLIAYVAGEAGVDELRRHLGERLPDYMIPGVFVAVAQLPRTPNGKLDRRALPEPGAEHGESSVGPRNRVEAELVRIWAQTLGLETVGVNENFFQLGGDSILSIQIVARARQAGLRLTVREMFQHQTIAELAAAAQPAKQSEAEQGEVVGKVELTPIQRWFFEQEFEEAHHWNQSVMLKVGRECGRKELEVAWRGIVRHHDGLRQRFVERAAGWEGWQAGSESEPELEWMEVASRGELERLAAERQRSLDLTRGPMVRATVFDLGEGERRLSVVAHHLVIDGVSWRILLEDLERGCRGEALPAKTTSWRSWTGRLKEYRGKEEARGEGGRVAGGASGRREWRSRGGGSAREFGGREHAAIVEAGRDSGDAAGSFDGSVDGVQRAESREGGSGRARTGRGVRGSGHHADGGVVHDGVSGSAGGERGRSAGRAGAAAGREDARDRQAASDVDACGSELQLPGAVRRK